jgi:hypothetical protein
VTVRCAVAVAVTVTVAVASSAAPPLVLRPGGDV